MHNFHENVIKFTFMHRECSVIIIFLANHGVGPGVFIAFIFSHLLQQGVLWLWSFITREGEKMI